MSKFLGVVSAYTAYTPLVHTNQCFRLLDYTQWHFDLPWDWILLAKSQFSYRYLTNITSILIENLTIKVPSKTLYIIFLGHWTARTTRQILPSHAHHIVIGFCCNLFGLLFYWRCTNKLLIKRNDFQCNFELELHISYFSIVQFLSL